MVLAHRGNAQEARQELAHRLREIADRLEADGGQIHEAEISVSQDTLAYPTVGEEYPTQAGGRVQAEVRLQASWPEPEPPKDYAAEARAAHEFLDSWNIEEGPLTDRMTTLLKSLFGEWVKGHLKEKAAGGSPKAWYLHGEEVEEEVEGEGPLWDNEEDESPLWDKETGSGYGYLR